MNLSNKKMPHTENHPHDMPNMDVAPEAMSHSGMGMVHVELLKRKFLVSILLSIPIFLFSPMMGMTTSFQIKFAYSDIVVLLFSTLLFFYGGDLFFRGALAELKDKKPAMMSLVTLGISVTYFYSLYIFIQISIFQSQIEGMDFFWELASLILIMLLGHIIEMNATMRAGDALSELAKLLPEKATLVQTDGTILEIQSKDIKLGDHLLIKAGEKLPADGRVIEGSTNINESMITGESKEVRKAIQDSVIGGSTNGSGTIRIEVTGVGASGYISKVMDLVSAAQNDKSKVETLSDKVASLLFYVALAVGISAFAAWYWVTQNLDLSLMRMVTVLIIACPHALGLAIPLVVARSASIGAQNGLLVKNRNALEIAESIQVVMTDKTGTLTEGKFKVTEIKSYLSSLTDDDILRMMGTLETSSTHPLSAGILNKLKEQDISISFAENVKTISGVGLSGDLDQKALLIVNASYLENNLIDYDKKDYNELSKQGYSISYLLIDNKCVGLVAQGDAIREDAKEFVKNLQKTNRLPVMLTGDSKEVAEKIALQLGIPDVFSELHPHDKERIIAEYQQKGNKVMMVGDGINDAPSLARADIGVAIGAGTDIAINSADVILVKSNPLDITKFFQLAQNTSKKMKQNLFWGAGYNVIAIPLAAGVLAPFGIILSPAAGAVLMSLSTIIVAVNAMTLKTD